MRRIQYLIVLLLLSVCINPLYLFSMSIYGDEESVYLYDLDEHELYQHLESGSLLVLSKLPKPFNILVSVKGNPGSVEIQVDGQSSNAVIINSGPYMYPDQNTAWNPGPGTQTITVKTYSQPDGGGTILDVYSLQVNVCDNVTDGGMVGGDEAVCGPFDPGLIYNQILPSGGSGELEYIWMESTTSAIFNDNNLSEWTMIPNSNSPTLDPEPITQTTYYIRCSRRGTCGEYLGESNVIKKEVVTDPWIFTSLDQTICSGETATLTGGAYQAFESMSSPGTFLGHQVIDQPGWSTYAAGIAVSEHSEPSVKERSSFRIVQGLFNNQGVSLESVAQPGYYLRESSNFLKLHPLENKSSFQESASFYVKAGLSDFGGISFESIESPGRYIQMLDNGLFKVDMLDSASDSLKATFTQDIAWADGPLDLAYQWSNGSTQPQITVQPTQISSYTLDVHLDGCTYQTAVSVQVDNCQDVVAGGCTGTLGVAAPYNLLVLGKMANLTDAVQGRVAVGGDLSVRSLHIGQQHQEYGSENLTPDPARADLIVGGDIVASSGIQVSHGSFSFTGGFQLVDGGFSIKGADGIISVNSQNADSYRLPPPFDFSFAKFQMESLSQGLAQLSENEWGTVLEGNVEIDNQTLVLFGTQANFEGTYVFFVDGADFGRVLNVELTDVAIGATIIINVGGTQVNLGNPGWHGFDQLTNRILFNFYEAGSLSLQSIKGSVLAPKADFTASNGEVWGQVIVDRVNTQSASQIHNHPFKGCVFPVLTYGNDFSDAPESYASASHVYDASRGGLITYLGTLIDFEAFPFYTWHGCGDDNDGLDDEDGIHFPGGAIASPGETKTIDVVVYSELRDVFLNIWIDYNGDGDFQDQGEHMIVDEIFDNPQKPSAEIFHRSLQFTIPQEAICGQTFMRARLLSDPGIQATGEGITGEVEDYMFTINCNQGGNYDYGDAPLTYGDAKHEILEGVSLGALIDSESGSQHTSFATGDDQSGVDDEDGVIFGGGPLISPNTDKHFQVSVKNSTGVTYYLSAWADTDVNGIFETLLIDDIPFDSDGTYESAVYGAPLRVLNQNQLCGKEVFVRFRLSNVEDIGADTGEVKGEVEDYALILTCETEDYEEQNLLPVAFLSFEGEAQHRQVFLEWVTGSEINNSHFEIEQSIDGIEFEPVGRVAGQGDTQEITRYSYALPWTKPGKAYFRLRQVDFDGSYSYSQMVEVFFSGKGSSRISLYPNPVRDKLHLDLNHELESRVEVTLRDMMGHQVARYIVNTDETGNKQVLSLANLASGVYIIHLTDGITQFTEKFVRK